MNIILWGFPKITVLRTYPKTTRLMATTTRRIPAFCLKIPYTSRRPQHSCIVTYLHIDTHVCTLMLHSTFCITYYISFYILQNRYYPLCMIQCISSIIYYTRYIHTYIYVHIVSAKYFIRCLTKRPQEGPPKHRGAVAAWALELGRAPLGQAWALLERGGEPQSSGPLGF